MKNLPLVLLVFIGLVLSNCEERLDLNLAFDPNTPLTLSHWPGQRIAGGVQRHSETIEVNSEKWNQLMDFAKNNLEGWRVSPASYLGDIFVTQNHIQLIYSIGSKEVVINIEDQDGASKQYVKKIKKGALDFLVE